MMLKKRIVDYHGRIENVKLYNKDPTNFIKEAKAQEEARLKAQKEAEKAKQLAEENGEEIEESKEPNVSAAAAAEEEEKKEPDYVEYDDERMTIFDIFQEYGKESKLEAAEDDNCKKTLFYNFTPYNAKDPVLLSLMSTHKYWNWLLE